MHEVELKVPEALLLKLRVPVGVIGVPGEMSATVPMHVVAPFTASGEEQLTPVEVVRSEAVRLKPPELPAWSMSLL